MAVLVNDVSEVIYSAPHCELIRHVLGEMRGLRNENFANSFPEKVRDVYDELIEEIEMNMDNLTRVIQTLHGSMIDIGATLSCLEFSLPNSLRKKFSVR